MEKAVVLLSGGLNGAVAAAAAAQHSELHMLFVNFHQRPLARELRAFEQLCDHFRVQHKWKAELTHFKQVGGNAFIDPGRRVDKAGEFEQGVAATFVPGLMPALLTVAASFACRIGAARIVTGLSEAIDEPPPGSAVLYPDNRGEFVRCYQNMLETAMPERTRMSVDAPLIDFSRLEIIRLGCRLNVPFGRTWSCYQNEPVPCGECFGCVSRTTGFLQAATVDPLAAAVTTNPLNEK